MSVPPVSASLDVEVGMLNVAEKTCDAVSSGADTHAGQLEPESRVMVLYTGGTIGMRSHAGFYEPEANYLPRAIKRIPSLNDQEYVDRFYSQAEIKPYVLPPIRHEEKRVAYWLFEYEPLLDSSDMTFDDWIRIAKDIKNSYEKYDGFVVLHGTDTLCYTASAVSFMFENLGKPIIFTGSQIPIAEVRSDGQENFIGALILAGNYDIPEVTICFNNKLFRGNRCSKMDNSALDAFNSPNMAPLVSMETSIIVDWQSIYRSPLPVKVSLHTNLNRNVGLLRLFPSITLDHVKAFLQEPIEGVVLQTYGAGNFPTHRRDILDELRKAVDRGIIIVNCSQCVRGKVDAHYATGKVLVDVGVTSGSDMTPETALSKLAYVLSQPDWTVEKKRKMMQKNLRGELSAIEEHDRFKSTASALKDLGFVRQFAKFIRVSSSQELQVLRDALYPPLICHAANNGDLQLLEQLSEIGANLGAADYDLRTSMHIAASTGRTDVVRYLLTKGVSVHAKDRWNDTPLMNATRNRHLECIAALMSAGAHLSVSATALGIELCTLASRGDLGTMKAWKVAGADLNSSDYDGRTPLHIATTRGNSELVKFLVDQGANPNAKDNFDVSSVDEAKKRGYTHLAILMTAAIERQAKPRRTTSSSQSSQS